MPKLPDTDAFPDERVLFAEESAGTPEIGEAPPRWKIVVADDDPQVHAVTQLVLANYRFENRGAEILSAFSGAEAKELLARHPDTALILLDVVMEDDDAGLAVVRYVREVLHNALVRIVLRTGQPGQAPEHHVVATYDINDYKEKTELTVSKLHTTITAALRAFRDLRALEHSRRSMERLAESAASLAQLRNLPQLGDHALRQILAFLSPAPGENRPPSGVVVAPSAQGPTVVAALGGLAPLKGLRLQELPVPLRHALEDSLLLGPGLRFLPEGFSACHRPKDTEDHLIYLEGFPPPDELDRNLLRILASSIAVALDNTCLAEEIHETQKELIFTLGEVVETRSQDTANHVRRVGEFAYLLGRLRGMDEETATLLRDAAPMHDVGKIGIPDAILHKPARLTAEEFTVMKTHTTIGHHILQGSHRRIMRAAAVIALEHHERWDGQGYPTGVRGDAIHLFARTTCLADVFDALTHSRVYKRPWSLDATLDYIAAEAGGHFDPSLVRSFLAHREDFFAVLRAYPDE